MFENHTIARIAGIPIRANLLLGYLLAIWAVYGASRGHAGPTVALIVISTVLLLLHELGHAFVARRFGLEVVDIVLWPLGGMARISDMPENAKVEAWVAAAGPLVNLVLAAVALPLLWVPAPPPEHFLELFGVAVPIGVSLHGLSTLFIVVNLAYGVLNLLPAFPMDGGRILRAFLGRGDRSWLAATDRATSIGAVIAWGVIILSLLQGACFMSLIGFFILWAGLRERWAVRVKHQAAQFGGEAGRFAGWESLLRQMQKGQGGAPDSDGGRTAFPHPDGDLADGSSGASTPDVGAAGQGFSDEDIERLESFRGRLQKPNDPEKDAQA